MTPASLPGFDRRASGVLLHPTSLPGNGAVGDMGPAARSFVDWLASAGQSCWQILPLVPTDPGGSPYNGLSAFAGNPVLVSTDFLVQLGLIDPEETSPEAAASATVVDYESAIRWKEGLLRLASDRFREGRAPGLRDAFANFRILHGEPWLLDYALFRALRGHFAEAVWWTWPMEIRMRQPAALVEWTERLSREITEHEFAQFLFDSEWGQLREYAAARSISIIGDLPIFVARDSADVWAHADLFQLDEVGEPLVVAGVPPDYFSETGQRWGNPLYRWDVLRQRRYDWWVDRFRRTFDMVDIVRLDHFRGFESYWEIPAGEPTAVQGRWVPGPGEDFFNEVEKQLGPLPIIAEDLGLITASVEALRDHLALPGMRVLQFAFDGDLKNPHLPANHPLRSVAYTGTHDNDTLAGWWEEASSEEKRQVGEWLGKSDPTQWDLIDSVLASPAMLAILPLQDVLGLDGSARMNTPGNASSNWTWRLSEAPSPDVARRLLEATRRSGRTDS